MFLFLLTLLVMRNKPALLDEAGDPPRKKPPDLDDSETALNYATAYYWDMYGEIEAQHNRDFYRLPLNLVIRSQWRTTK